ncbi:transglycosylase domain-containing protein [Sphingomonas prati]|uniref:Penicillin-binding protein 1A n=1 Tax=Sphingomonas prati TaxID=1843237 RepID=A0A7W9BP66_9SPHN|nr:PBP1A family penicillin-binding protein [Sphingomonas prati]MBB5727573.1 penicillin-binding protein 1A [Sphingomonas prati]GGE79068.1 penicillin-binding protein 1A [Sphingomonas prati]
MDLTPLDPDDAPRPGSGPGTGWHGSPGPHSGAQSGGQHPSYDPTTHVLTPILPRRRRWPRWLGWRRIVGGGFLLFLVMIAWLAITAPLSKSLRPIAPPSVTLLSAGGRAIARRGAVIDKPVDVTKLPDHVGEAFMAIEDRRFRSHLGIDPQGIARAAWANVRAGGVREGGSTITQQLAKVAFLDSDRTAGRKLREVMIAFWLEAWLTKDDILSRYLSNVYFGDNVYGLRAAARHYFDKRPEQLNIGESAMLAGLMKAPSRLAPTSNLAGARARQKLVVAAMEDAKFIDAATAARVRPARLHVRTVGSLPTGTYFADWAMPQARDRAGTLYAEQSVATTLDDRMQQAAVRAVNRAALGGAQVALVAMRPNGEVVAMIGGRDYKGSSFNRATQARRQPGSTFKLFVYLAALRAGMSPSDMVSDRPITVEGWSPANSDRKYRGDITLRQAFAVSSNVAAVRLQEQVGRDKVIRAARDLGVTSPMRSDPSLALGTSGMTLLELTSAFAAVADDAYPVKPHGLPAEERSWFDKVWDRQSSFGRARHDALLDLLSATVNQGTGRNAALRTQVFGKTGTTQNNRDAIFIGFAGDIVTGVWVGNDDNTPLKGVAGGGLPARIWRDFMASAIGSAPRVPAAAKRPAAPRLDEVLPGLDVDIPPITVGDVTIGVDRDGLTVAPSGDPDARRDVGPDRNRDREPLEREDRRFDTPLPRDDPEDAEPFLRDER